MPFLWIKSFLAVGDDMRLSNSAGGGGVDAAKLS